MLQTEAYPYDRKLQLQTFTVWATDPTSGMHKTFYNQLEVMATLMITASTPIKMVKLPMELTRSTLVSLSLGSLLLTST
jgi:hypothetical protein